MNRIDFVKIYFVYKACLMDFGRRVGLLHFITLYVTPKSNVYNVCMHTINMLYYDILCNML